MDDWRIHSYFIHGAPVHMGYDCGDPAFHGSGAFHSCKGRCAEGKATPRISAFELVGAPVQPSCLPVFDDLGTACHRQLIKKQQLKFQKEASELVTFRKNGDLELKQKSAAKSRIVHGLK